MIAPDDFDSLIADVARLNGLDDETAGLVVVAVGDTPIMDKKSGKIVAKLEDGRELLIEWPDEDSA